LHSTPLRWMGNLTAFCMYSIIDILCQVVIVVCTFPKWVDSMGHGAIDNTPHLQLCWHWRKRERGFGTGNKWTHRSFNAPSSPPRFSEMVYHRKQQDMPMSAGQSLGRAGLRVGRLPAHKHDYKPFIFGPLSSLQTISLPYKRL